MVLSTAAVSCGSQSVLSTMVNIYINSSINLHIIEYIPVCDSDGRYYQKSIEIIDTYKSIDTFDTSKKYR